MRKAEVMEKSNNGIISYTAVIKLENSKQVGFTRRDLALCFFPKQVAEKADRNYEVITIDGTILPFDNPRLVRRLWEIVQKKYIYDGTVKKRNRHNFDWSKVVNKLRRSYKVESIHTLPTRHTIISEVEITTATSNYDEHVSIINKMRQKIRENAPHLTYRIDCHYNVIGSCPV